MGDILYLYDDLWPLSSVQRVFCLGHRGSIGRASTLPDRCRNVFLSPKFSTDGSRFFKQIGVINGQRNRYQILIFHGRHT
jgi:hypothetical protein